VLEAERQNGVTEQDQVINDPSFYPATCSTNPAACSSATTLAPAIFRISPNLRTPYIMMASAGADKPIGKIGNISANYQLYRGDHLYLTRNINAPLPGTYDPDDPTSGVRPLGTSQNIYEYQSEGDSVRHRLVVSVNLHTKSIGLFSNYMFAKSQADTFGIGSFPSNNYDLHQGLGPLLQRFPQSRLPRRLHAPLARILAEPFPHLPVQPALQHRYRPGPQRRYRVQRPPRLRHRPHPSQRGPHPVGRL